MSTMATGTVKWFNNAKGYGFILPEDGSADLFAHYSSIQMEGYRTLRAGQLVTFDQVDGPKGGHAANICTLEPTVEQSQQLPAIADEGSPESLAAESQPYHGSEVVESSQEPQESAHSPSPLITTEPSPAEELTEPH